MSNMRAHFLLLVTATTYIQPVYGAGITTEVGAPLGTISDCEMVPSEEDGIPTCTLNFGVYEHFGPTSSFTTRHYLAEVGTDGVIDENTGMPGPTIRVRAGQTFQVNIVNQLDDANNQPMGSDINLPHLPNTTNFHTHGLHISGLSPGDDVFSSISPGESLVYTYQVPDNHMGGTFFYHPHHHGSVSLQLGGGACGLIIVEDEPDSLPPQVAAMEDIALVMQYAEPNRVKQLQNVFDDHLLNTVGGGPPVLLTNGQTSPVKQVESGIWTRFRIMYTSMSHIVIISKEETSSAVSCEVQLLAKDGIYLHHAPRLISDIYLPEGGRADIAVRCVGEGQVNFMAAVQSRQTFVALTLDVSDTVFFTPNPVSAPTLAPTTLATLVTDADDADDDDDDAATIDEVDVGTLIRSSTLTPFVVNRPCYLVDTRSAVPTTIEALTLGTGNPNTKLNDIFFSSPDESLNPSNPFITGTLGEIILVQGTFVHVLHIHVNPFQLALLSPVIDEVYFQEGDWHDTLNVFVAQPAGSAQMRIRMWIDKYAGHAVVHCHMLNDEDAGMMNTYAIEGEEGQSVDEVARVIDPLCYSDFSRGYVLDV